MVDENQEKIHPLGIDVFLCPSCAYIHVVFLNVDGSKASEGVIEPQHALALGSRLCALAIESMQPGLEAMAESQGQTKN